MLNRLTILVVKYFFLLKSRSVKVARLNPYKEYDKYYIC